MSKLALTTATRDDVRKIAQENIDGQTCEVALMTNWLRDWYGATLSEGTIMPQDIMD